MDYNDYGNGLRNDIGYDGRGFPSMTQTLKPLPSPGQNYTKRTYWRDTRDRITAWKKTEDGRGDRYAYDAEGQLITAAYNALTPEGTPSGAARSDIFYYDAMGNRKDLNHVANRGWMNFTRRNNGLNQYLSWANDYPAHNSTQWGSYTFYDDNFGSPPAPNPVPPWAPPGNAVTMGDGWLSASYNALKQPIALWSPRLPTGNFLWLGFDPLGRCVKRWVAPMNSAGTSPATTNPATYFYYDGWNMVQEGVNASAPGRVYVHGTRVDEIVASCVWSGTHWAYHHYDARGHCILLTLPSGAIQEKYDYDAFGMPYCYDAAGALLKVNNRPGSPWGNRFLFTGREWLSDIGVYDFRNRLYQPELGRFMQPDPKEFEAGDYNLYRYCHNDPVNKTDPTGLIWDTIADIGFIAYDVYKLSTDGAGQGNENWKALGLDSLAAAIPFATGAGPAYRGARAIERASEASSAAKKASSAGKMQRDVERGRAPKEVDRVDRAGPGAKEPHVHYKDGTSSTQSGEVHDKHRGEPNPSNKTREWLEKHGWKSPKRPDE